MNECLVVRVMVWLNIVVKLEFEGILDYRRGFCLGRLVLRLRNWSLGFLIEGLFG